MSFSLTYSSCLFHWSIYICCSFRGGILSVVFPAVCFRPAGNLECPCLFSDLILFPFLLLFFYIVPYPSFSSMSFSLIYICCSFRGGILSVVFPTVAICFWPAGNLECPCLFSDLILFPFLRLFFYIVPYPSFSSMSFSLTYICCSFRGGILSAVFPAVAICFWHAGNLECPCLFSDLILFPFLLLFFYIVPYPSFSSMSFSLIYICCSFRRGILSVVFPTVAMCFWPAGNLECPCLFSDLILFPFLLLFFYIVPYPSFSSMSFSLIYICCSFRGGILSVVFPAVAICFWPAGNLECPCLFSDLILFPFLLLFFYIVPYPSFSSMSFSLIYICCSFRGGILSAVVATVAICFWPAGNLECPCLFSDLILFPFLLLFFYIVPYPSFSSMSMSFSLVYICCCFRGGILSVVFRTVAICFWPAGNLECPCLFSDLILFPFLRLFFYIVPYPSFSSMSFSLIYICCSFRGGILSVVFPTVAICFWPAGNLECPCLFSDLILFPFLLLFFYIVPYPSFSSMSFSLIYICCSFRGGILSAVFPTVAICFWPAGNLECPCLFSDLILFPFLLLFFYIVPYPSFSSMSFSLIYICCSFRGGILSVVFPTVAICFSPAGNLECPCLFSDLILFPFLLLFFYIVPYPSFSSMSFSLI